MGEYIQTKLFRTIAKDVNRMVWVSTVQELLHNQIKRQLPDSRIGRIRMGNNSPADRKRPVRGCICMISRPHQLSPFPIDLGRQYFTEFHGAVNHRLNGIKIKNMNLIACRISYTDRKSTRLNSSH